MILTIIITIEKTMMGKQMSISRLYECIETRKVNQSQAREAIFRVLMDAEDECLSVSRILDELSCVYPKKVSLNTVYRHLNLFVSCKLAVMIQDDFKRAYYSLTQDKPSAYIICTKCNSVGKLTMHLASISKELEDSEFVTIHKKCQKCKERLK